MVVSARDAIAGVAAFAHRGAGGEGNAIDAIEVIAFIRTDLEGDLSIGLQPGGLTSNGEVIGIDEGHAFGADILGIDLDGELACGGIVIGRDVIDVVITADLGKADFPSAIGGILDEINAGNIDAGNGLFEDELEVFVVAIAVVVELTGFKTVDFIELAFFPSDRAAAFDRFVEMGESDLGIGIAGQSDRAGIGISAHIVQVMDFPIEDIAKVEVVIISRIGGQSDVDSRPGIIGLAFADASDLSDIRINEGQGSDRVV